MMVVSALLLSAAFLGCVEASRVVAYHMVCCRDNSIAFPPDSGCAQQDWARMLSQIRGGDCLHKTGVGRQNVAREGNWPFLTAKLFTSSHNTFGREKLAFGRPPDCAAVELIYEGKSPRRENLDTFTPGIISSLASHRPIVRLEVGGAIVENGTITFYETLDYRWYLPKQGYRSDKRYAEAERLDKVITTTSIEAALPDEIPNKADFVAFLEYATNTSALTPDEARSTIFDDQLRRIMTQDKVKLVDVTRKLNALRKKLSRISKENTASEDSTWLEAVPLSLLRRKGPRTLSRSSVSSKRTGTRSSFMSMSSHSSLLEDRESEGEPRDTIYFARQSSSASIAERLRSSIIERVKPEDVSDGPTADLRMLTNAHFTEQWLGALVKTHEVLHTDEFIMWNALWSNSMYTWMKRSINNINSVNNERIVAFYLVNGPLEATSTGYGQVITSSIQNMLERKPNAIFSVCADNINLHPLLIGRNELSDEYRFAAVGPRTFEYKFGTLEDLDIGDRKSAQCLVLALLGITFQELRTFSLKQKLVGPIFMFNFRSDKDESRRLFVHTAFKADVYEGVSTEALWAFLGGNKREDIGTLLNSVGKTIQETGTWPPIEVDQKATVAWENNELETSTMVTMKCGKNRKKRVDFVVPTSCRIRIIDDGSDVTIKVIKVKIFDEYGPMIQKS